MSASTSPLRSGTFNFWIDRDTDPNVFSVGIRRKWGSFQMGDEACVICSDGPTLAATLRMGSHNPLPLFRIPFQVTLKRRHLVTIGWSTGTMKVYLDAELIAISGETGQNATIFDAA